MDKEQYNMSKGNTSAGLHSNMRKKLKNAMRRDYLQSPDRIMNQLKAHRAGKKTVVTIENPNKNETKFRYIRVDGKHIFKPASLAQ